MGASIRAILLSFALGACQTTDNTSEPTADPPPDGAGKADWFGDDEPFADLYRTTASTRWLPVRGRLIDEDPDDIGALDLTPLSQVSQSELEDETVSLSLVTPAGIRHALGEVTVDNEGYLDLRLDVQPLELSPGPHTLEVWFEDALVGDSRVTLLAPDRTEPVVRSDLDWTYLRTDFHGITALARLLGETAFDKQTLPAMDQIYRGLRGDGRRPLTFLSGSPRFFKRTLEAKAILDDVEQDGLVLKPFKDIVAADLLTDPTSIVSNLEEQVGYKLYWLFRLRAELPPQTPEILLGDDSEADFVAYNLYARWLRGDLPLDAFQATLVDVGVSDHWLPRVVELAEGAEGAPPVAIYINRTEVPGTTFSVDDWMLEGQTRVHDGAWPLALDLYEEGWLAPEDVEATKARLLALGDDEASLNARAEAADFLSPETLERF